MEKYTIDIPPFEIPEFDLMSPKEAEPNKNHAPI